ncbi:uncharacterized protein LOC110827850 isoform X1 [Zootermopsis nevadensis]|uniref:uncharacterized protein LOC110827850 isoform X1 n=1 Tax=Zootermopsis nevadensis TaxID=136037 RepID=UPI000B8EE4B4|nr:uncharacterized protein LOC110827850 isoform X1 [Zootermopsis nevadensis]
MGEMMSANKDEDDKLEQITATLECHSGKETLVDEDFVKYNQLQSRTSVTDPNNYPVGNDLQLCLDGVFNSECSGIEDFLVECIKQHQDAIDFTRHLNHIVSPWIAFALLIHQLLLVAEVFQLATILRRAYSYYAVLRKMKEP